ncbi:16S rRNA (guanine(527)-N(7))-methyltransferase RsmG [Sulfitobacter sp. JB4-11]|uniref:16S rRNA (guanine(527)-N(7))-methyltransferase RsmG n=1 Tax=Sulfitobacter rhodophyticola TaxID=3238304 RepID=UPI0035173425
MTLPDLDVSRETLARLQVFADLVEKWTQKINLVSKASVSDLWSRHILDSAQIFDLAPPCRSWVDLGSGGGFPAIVIAIIATEKRPDITVTLVESDQRKCAFLRSALREMSLSGTVISERIEDLAPLQAEVLSARALADLTTLLSFAEHHLAAKGTCIFPKGENWRKEHDAAQQQWSYSCEAITSNTNPAAAVLKIEDIKRV